MDEMNFNGNQMPDIEPTTDFPDSLGDSVIPDPVASPESYGESVIPDPVASPESYGESVIPDPVASPESYGDFSIPTPDFGTDEISSDSIVPPTMDTPAVEPVTESITAESIVSPMMEQPAPKAEPAAAPAPSAQPQDPKYSAHYSWNGSQYVEQNTGAVPPQNGYERSGYSSAQTGAHTVPNYQQPVYSQNASGQMNLDPDLEKRANTVQVLGIISLIMNLLGCGGCIGLILPIVGLVKANGMSTVMHMMSEDSKKRVSLGKTLCIISIILSILFVLGSFLMILLPALIGYMDASSAY